MFGNRVLILKHELSGSIGGSGGSNGSNGFEANNVISNDPTLVGIGQGASFAACLANIKLHVATPGAGGAGGQYALSLSFNGFPFDSSLLKYSFFSK